MKRIIILATFAVLFSGCICPLFQQAADPISQIPATAQRVAFYKTSDLSQPTQQAYQAIFNKSVQQVFRNVSSLGIDFTSAPEIYQFRTDTATAFIVKGPYNYDELKRNLPQAVLSETDYNGVKIARLQNDSLSVVGGNIIIGDEEAIRTVVDTQNGGAKWKDGTSGSMRSEIHYNTRMWIISAGSQDFSFTPPYLPVYEIPEIIHSVFMITHEDTFSINLVLATTSNANAIILNNTLHQMSVFVVANSAPNGALYNVVGDMELSTFDNMVYATVRASPQDIAAARQEWDALGN